MNIERGLTTDTGVEIPWSISPKKLALIVGADCLHTVSRGYMVTKCSLLGGMDLSLGFHFRGLRLRQFELFRHFQLPSNESYAEFQKHLVQTFGPPTRTVLGRDDEGYGRGFDDHVWRFGSVRICHYVFERFGPEEHVQITN
jgi:hypothetical protein